MNSFEQLYVTFKTFMEMTPDEYSYEGVEFMVGREKKGCSLPSERVATGYLAVEGNLEFLVREALQPPTLHELPDFRRAYDVMLEGLTAMKNMRDTEFEKRTESLYWTSYVGRSILSIREELEDPDAKEWSSSTIRLFLSQVKEVHKEITEEGVDLETLAGKYFLPETLKEFAPSIDPLPPVLWLSKVKAGLHDLLECSGRREEELAQRYQADLARALGSSPKGKLDPLRSRDGFLIWSSQYMSLKRALRELNIPDWRHVMFKIAKDSLQTPVDQRCCENMLGLEDLERYLRDHYVTNVDVVGDLLAPLLQGRHSPHVLAQGKGLVGKAF